MAVILDIPMPGGCGKCPLNDDNWGCIVTGKPVQEDSRPETCPLYDLNREQALDIGIDLSRVLSWTGKVYLPKKVREKIIPSSYRTRQRSFWIWAESHGSKQGRWCGGPEGGMMYLTTANVKDYLGKTLDVKKRILGLYPYKVIQTPSGEYLAVDRAGVGVVIAQPRDIFNAIYFEIVDGKEV